MNINGITPAVVEDNFFILDKSGTFSLDKSIWATIYLVGGGCDGENGYYNADQNTYHGGKGGDSGYIFKFGKIALFKNVEYNVSVAENNDKSGTSITVNGRVFNCGDMGCLNNIGGSGGIINSSLRFISPKNGISGISTPYGTIGSSGGGGAVVYKYINTPFGRGGEGAGTGCEICSGNVFDNSVGDATNQINAQNYGCGGGGNAFCGDASFGDIGSEGKGKGGCVIIVYELYDENFPDLTVRYWGNSKESYTVKLETLLKEYNNVLEKNLELKEKIKQIESENG